MTAPLPTRSRPLLRVLGAAAVLAVAAALALLPSADRARLAALDAHTLLSKVEAEDGLLEGEQRSHAQRMLECSAAKLLDADQVELRLGDVRVYEVLGQALEQHAVLARRSLVRGLREHASDAGIQLEIIGERPEDAVPGRGLMIDVRVDAQGLAVGWLEPRGMSRTWIEEPGWKAPSRWSVAPPLIAILLAVLFRQPVMSLFFGVLGAAFILERFYGGAIAPAAQALVASPGRFLNELLLPELFDSDRQKIIGFVLFMLAMVGVLTRSGGIRGLMDGVARLAKSVRRTQIATFLIGLLIFFDDYANTILCGSTMRPLTDRFRIAREKLAYIVDSTAAPVAGLSLLSTWIAFEVSTFSAQLPAANLTPQQGYQVFIESLPYRFYCILTLFFVGLVVFTGRDFGPMRRAEERARSGGGLVRPGSSPLVGDAATSLEAAPGARPSFWVGLLPILTFVVTSVFLIFQSGGAFDGSIEATGIRFFTEVLGAGDPFTSLLWGSIAGFVLALVFALAQNLLHEMPGAIWATLRSMGVAILILYFAWMLGRACGELGTANYLTALLGDRMNAALLPAVLFILSGIVAFSTGSSWSTMTILLPLVVGLAFGLGEDSGLFADAAAASGRSGGYVLLLMSIGAVLEGAIFGDHCSPISDTTVMSSIACASDHIDHVRTQAPYSVTTMLVALGCGYLPAAFLGWSPWLGLGVGAAVLTAILFVVGRRTHALQGAKTP